MIVSVASGKGGTGKTTVAVNLALSLDHLQFFDCDVEEPNAHLFLRPVIKEKHRAYLPVPLIIEDKCDFCGLCKEVCAYHALAVFPGNENVKGSVLVFPQLCHSCGACSLLCPEHAITEVSREIGIIESGNVEKIQFFAGRLHIGEAISPPLIRQVKMHLDPAKTVIIDTPPGTSCPVIAAVKGSDFCILVTEPTPFGLNDLILAVDLLEKLNIPYGVVINRYDIGDKKVDRFCRERSIPILMRIPFDREIAFLYSKGIPLVKEKKEYLVKFQDIFNQIKELNDHDKYNQI